MFTQLAPNVVILLHVGAACILRVVCLVQSSRVVFVGGEARELPPHWI